MPDTEQPETDQLSAQHRHAQASALDWAQRAETEHQAATKRADYARDKTGTDYLRSQVAQARDDAQLHRGNSYEASRLAEMWARVALALAPPQPPANGQPATYDLHVALDTTPEALDQAIRKQVTTRQVPGQT